MIEQIAEYEQRIAYYEKKLKALAQDQAVNEDVITFIRDMLDDVQKCHQQNVTLRKLVLKSSAQQNKMSTKLRDALYE
ncbi:hypothetical protein [Paenibacillus pini]|uniref:Uncharacterized protein n=1 Tax=Paenibacillus pini JCM 16418 TaxID=1236976 RepID=W7YDF6_9BACL|nr:hypothetical protein [Paenibacillus pini]GAF08960.1 hypothetical protein JCM16418_3071 [Paenibacillus pini JCM 16418]